MSKGYASSYRIVLLSTGLFVCFGALAVRLVWLHVINRDELLGTITKTRRQVIVETARRGDIFDKNGVTLATSRAMRVLGVDRLSLRPQDESKWPELARLIGLPEDELRRIFTTKYRDENASPASVAAGASSPSSVVFNVALPSASPSATPTGTSAAPAVTPPAIALTGVNAGPAPIGTEANDGVELDPTPDEKGRRVIRWAKLRDDVPEELYEEIMKLGIRGITGDRGYKRIYPGNQLASHVIGYVNKAQEPVEGLEAYADFYLRGQNGWRVGEKDGRGRELAQYRTREVPRVDGYNVTLTLDMTVQDIVEQELAAIAEKFTPVKASIIVSDPRTGYILGIANYPTFDPNNYLDVQQDGIAARRNAAVADVYEPGSVFKIVAAAAALEERLATPNHVFDCDLERILHRGKMVPLPKEDHKMGNYTVTQIISHSSNKGAAQLAIRVGEEKFYDYVRAFGFGGRLGFPFGGEENGQLRPYKKWDAIDITRIAMGHSVSSTVLQMHQAMSVIANGGVLMKPQIIRQISDASGDIVYDYAPEPIRRVVSADTAGKVAEMLMGVVIPKQGTAAEAAIPGFDVAGKTGTTQKLIEITRADGTKIRDYSNRHHVASFVGFFPAHNPQVVISVIVDEAKVQTAPFVAYGRVAAAPSFKRIGERLIPILDIKTNTPPARPRLYAAANGGRQ